MNLRHLTFRLLEVYVTVVRTGSVTAAARQLHLTQPTVSQQLKRLAETVAEPLFLSLGSKLELTDTGRELYRTALDVTGRFADFQDYLAEQRGGHRGRFSIALVNTAQYVLPRVLGPYSHAFPDVDMTVHIGNRQQLLDRFERQLDDIYVFSHPPSSGHALAARFLRNPLVMLVPAQHPLAQSDRVSVEALLTERLLQREPGSATRMLFESWLHSRGLQWSNVLQMASNEAIRVGVASGMGVAVMSRHALPEAHPGVVILPVEGFPIESHWHFIIRRDRRLPHAARGFLEYAAGSLEQCLPAEYLCNEVAELFTQTSAGKG
ncbi:MAG: LysR family transcriptional regulator [Oceanospirillales bacterium]|uniref:DNA-binding transcriptional LysR family regulator n=1 Tax=Marinobacterium halophilum TaxID=267374 RepID=A0A2P8EIW8_9GAMM|nr:LysR family transcriptional regulator [Marinobacterium halophilum]MBR9829966.1 LysR family transcriptional regulator [Oceanospirillales bacterium]PSL09381.1 DNA-binding transcriptional LysR family regulator [Marinobacterium halophilum]